MGELLKSFNHVTREIQIYFLSGFLLYVEIAFLLFKDNFIYCSPPKNATETGFIVLVCYISGHIIYAVTSVIESIVFIFIREKKDCLSTEIKTFQKDKETYREFIERYSTLYIMRINLSTTFLILTAISMIYSIDLKIILLNLTAFGLMGFLGIWTKIDYCKIIHKADNLLN